MPNPELQLEIQAKVFHWIIIQLNVKFIFFKRALSTELSTSYPGSLLGAPPLAGGKTTDLYING